MISISLHSFQLVPVCLPSFHQSSVSQRSQALIFFLTCIYLGLIWQLPRLPWQHTAVVTPPAFISRLTHCFALSFPRIRQGFQSGNSLLPVPVIILWTCVCCIKTHQTQHTQDLTSTQSWFNNQKFFKEELPFDEINVTWMSQFSWKPITI